MVAGVAIGLLLPAAAAATVRDAAAAEPEPAGAAVSSLEAVDIGAVEARIGALLLSGQHGGDVEGALAWSVSGHGDDGSAEIPFTIEVDGEQLLGDGGGRTILVGIYAYLVDEAGLVAAHSAQGLRLDREVYADRIQTSGLKFVGRFRAQPGSYALRVMVRDHVSGRFFLSWSAVDAPTAAGGSLQLLPPVFPGRPTEWLLVRQAGTEPTVTVADGRAVLPAARPTVPEQRGFEAFVPDLGWGPDARIGISVVDRIGRTVAEPAVEAMLPSGDGFRRLEIAPLDLPADTYTLITTLEDGRSGEVHRHSARIQVIGEGPRLAWAADRDTTSADAGTAPSLEKGRSLRRRELRSGYLAALRRLADGEPYDARRFLAELERRAVAAGTPKAVRTLAEAEEAVLDQVAEAAPEGLASAALLHRQLARSYLARNEGLLAVHSRSVAVSAAERLGRLRPEDDFATSLMVDVAVDLARSQASSAGRGILQRALRLDPGSIPALLSLGFSHERAAEHHEAAATYSRLLEVAPNLDEARLRLAVNLIRTGRPEEGEALLEGLLDGDPPPWIARVAAQERVRLLRDTGRTSVAEAAARASLAEMPDDQRLWILLAAILDRQERYAESLEAMRNLPPPTRGVAPRARYAEWPDLGVATSAQRLIEHAGEAAAALATALAEIAE
ncbi:MAG TPA: tetratricopeptide repeat protein [Candidatus Sulfomarinibacteraceae bacterium]|nr:tetratricopeptide repeat protein [Candidatus Sulfomarinibacteraceae bacterium]